MDETGVEHGLALLREAVDVLLAADLDLDDATADATGIVSVIESLETQSRRLEAVDARVLAAAGERHAAHELARGSLRELLVQRLRLSPGEARARVRRAGDLGPRRAVTGEALEPIHPVLSAAQAHGAVSGVQIDMITRGLGRIPADIAVEAMPVAETFLTEVARHESPRELGQSIDSLLLCLDPDGAEPRDEQVYRGRHAYLVRHDDGSWSLRGSLTDETGLMWRTILDSLSKPVPTENGGTQHEAPAGERDERSTGQRVHDALTELGERILRSGTLPDSGGAPVTVVLRAGTAGLDDLSGSAESCVGGVVQTQYGDVMRARALARIAGDAEVIPVLFDRSVSNGKNDCRLYLGRTQRLANRAQRRALTARDGGCSFPACSRPASWCEVHHLIPWAVGGRTDIDNLCLLCPFHHREFERRGWAAIMVGGRPHWRPPRWIDPDRVPVRNTVHHLPEIVFRPGGDVVARR